MANKTRKIISGAAGACVLLALLLFVPLSAQAATASTIQSIDIAVDLAADGSAVVTEVWDIDVGSGITEWFLPRINLDQQAISDLSVSENGVAFENTGAWDVNATLEQKAQKCGIVTVSGGYELCWGVGSTGRHSYTVQYRITNFVKACTDGAFIRQTLVPEQNTSIKQIRAVIRFSGHTFTVENTGVWGAGFEGTIYVEDGEVVAETTNSSAPFYTFDVLVQFAEGMFQPLVRVNKPFSALKGDAMEGMVYPDTDNAGRYENESSGLSTFFTSSFGRMFNNPAVIMAIVAAAGVALLSVAKTARAKGGGTGGGRMKPEYKQAPYWRELPFGGRLPATFARLKDLGQHGSDGNIIGAYLLRWIRTRQVDIVPQETGTFRKTREDAIRLYAPRLDMAPVEWKLYEMLQKAAGSDGILQSKEFEKWSKRNYTVVQGWLEQYKNAGVNEMRSMGALADVDAKTFFGLVNTKKSVLTPQGEKLTIEMFGFKKYLQDFTIINEREAREVQLWDEYLVFAQVFGIAEEVASQFKQLYPAYFTEMARQMGTTVDVFDLIMINRLAHSFGHSMQTGMRAGFNAASSYSGSGGGGGSTFSGGGFSGSSGGGGVGGGR